jgi:hypothetical protein
VAANDFVPLAMRRFCAVRAYSYVFAFCLDANYLSQTLKPSVNNILLERSLNLGPVFRGALIFVSSFPAEFP